jgi:hypothetical protein
MPGTTTRLCRDGSTVHDPANPAAGSPGPDPGGAGYESARENVGQVLAWYTQQIMRERRAGIPNEALMEELKAAQRACVSDQKALEEASPAQVARIAADYEARLNDLKRA